MATPRHTAVVTGAKGQLGEAIIKDLSSSGLSVVAASRKSIEYYDQETKAHSWPGCDLSTVGGARQLEAIVSSIPASRLSIVNCVGSFPGYKPFLDVDFVEAKKTFDSNFVAVYQTALVLVPLMVRAKGGHFLSFTSLSRPDAFPLMAAYDSAKAAIEQLTRHLANEFGNLGVQANSLALATLRTPAEIELKPHGDFVHWVDPAEVAVIVRRLLCDGSSLINGNIIKCYHYSPLFFETAYKTRVSK
jgi:NAD(P)-dependent dehydrogenase (short-subunit alcohol dehydrogenase family)